MACCTKSDHDIERTSYPCPRHFVILQIPAHCLFPILFSSLPT
jgi:hypothetical protein